MNLESYKYASMCQKLAKAAEKAKEKKRSKGREAALGAMAGLAGTEALDAGQAGAGALVEKGIKGEKGLKSYLLGRKVQWKSPVPVTRLPLIPVAGYFPALDRAIVGGKMKTPGIIAHETGHGMLQRNPVGKLVQNLKLRDWAMRMTGTPGRDPFTGQRSLLRYATPAAGVGLAAGLAADEESKGKALAAALGVPAAMSAPVLLSEGGASLSGLLSLRRAGASPKQLMRAAKTLAPAFGTYATHLGKGVTMGGAGYAAGRGLRAAAGLDEESEKPKKPKEKGKGDA